MRVVVAAAMMAALLLLAYSAAAATAVGDMMLARMSALLAVLFVVGGLTIHRCGGYREQPRYRQLGDDSKNR